ncbi:hypothetical protein G6F46_002737 [Rhizopus delemar]|uniref:Small ribosomal subunit protein uS17 n=3 Tax=Rhizopus TaxID=4842 RepID=A0A9P6ZAG1_9FUNG|nr:hypothetical protein G6F43_001251 [Rhizopus delemar]KAG1549869.1 hypothetical protein G6F51_002797 [Rhizopus arrhizus]KAG1463943.1 hypothetical protein G6F55_002089 [Rhizopus delemar]KAG1502807.1 hypothetical protein G6F54_002101 [Rhizopus delemar]KAG1515620.1 hypothetical protein G6F53_002783 [Rhizopus delemar]
MRPARVLNLFISNILPRHESLLLRLQRRNPSTCLGCGRFQSRWKFLRSYSTQPNTIDTSKIRTTETCISIVKLAKQRRPSEALSTYLKLVEQGGFPNQEALYSLARSLYVNNHLVGMQALYDTLDQLYNTCPFSNRTQRSLTYIYTMFINLIARTTGDMQAIQKVCQNMSQPIMRGNVVIYNTLIKTFLENGDIENAKKAYEELKRHSAPTVATFGIWMKDAVERRDMKAMMRYLDEMEAYSIPPDYAMVDMVVSVLCHTEKAFQKQAGIFQNSKDAKKRNQRWFKEVGNGFKTPKEAKVGTYIDKKCPFVGEVNIQGRILTGVVVSTKMKRTLVVRRDYLHYIPKYNRYEKRHKNISAHVSPAFDNQAIQVGDMVTIGQCRPLSKTVRFNVIKVSKAKGTAKAFNKF